MTANNFWQHVHTCSMLVNLEWARPHSNILSMWTFQVKLFTCAKLARVDLYQLVIWRTSETHNIDDDYIFVCFTCQGSGPCTQTKKKCRRVLWGHHKLRLAVHPQFVYVPCWKQRRSRWKSFWFRHVFFFQWCDRMLLQDTTRLQSV